MLVSAGSACPSLASGTVRSGPSGHAHPCPRGRCCAVSGPAGSGWPCAGEAVPGRIPAEDVQGAGRHARAVGLVTWLQAGGPGTEAQGIHLAEKVLEAGRTRTQMRPMPGILGCSESRANRGVWEVRGGGRPRRPLLTSPRKPRLRLWLRVLEKMVPWGRPGRLVPGSTVRPALCPREG